jgi:hypothetical protein
MNYYAPMRTYRALIIDENAGLNRVLSAKRIDFKLRATYIVQLFHSIFIMPPWLLYVWIKDSRFGAQPECNHRVKYVFVFVTVRATVNWLRILMIVILSVNWYFSLTNLRGTYYALRKMFADSYEGSESGVRVTAFARVPWPLRVTWVHSWFPINMIILTHRPSLAVYGIASAELIVCGVSFSSPSRRHTYANSHRFTVIARSSSPVRMIGVLARLLPSCCYCPFLWRYWPF